MCELLALSANTPTDLCFSFHGLRRRGGARGDHGDGWGLASIDSEGQGVRLYREDAPAAFSPVAAESATLHLKAHCSIAHIRKATRGVVALRNCHPFHRRWHGQDWLFTDATTRLHVLTRRAPFRQARLVDDDLSVDFAELAGPNDVVTIVSTEPLTTNEAWEPLQPGKALWIVRGEVQALGGWEDEASARTNAGDEGV